VIDGWCAADQRSGSDIIGDAALWSDDSGFAHLAVADHSDLPRQNHTIAYFRGAAEADLRAEQGIVADLRSVADLHQVVNLDSTTDVGFADTGAVDAGVGLDFHIVFDHNWGGLRNFVPFAIVSLGKAEAVRADDDSVVQQDVIADAAVLANHGVRMGEEIVADLYSAIDNRVRQQDGMIADLDVLVDDNIGTEVSIASNLGGFMDNCCRMNSGRVAQRLVEEFEGAREAVVGIRDAQRGGRNGGKVEGYDYRGGLGQPGCGRIFGIGDEGDFSCAGLLDAVEASDLGIGGAVLETRVEGGGDLRKFHGGWVDAK